MSPDHSNEKPGENGRILDGVTFEVIVHRLQRPEPGGEWLIRVYAADEHIHSAEGGVPLSIGLNEADRAMRRYLVKAGALDPANGPRLNV